jgi:hypothetical protein
VLLERKRKRLNREILFEKKKSFAWTLYRFIFIVYKNKKIFLSNLICIVGHEKKL